MFRSNLKHFFWLSVETYNDVGVADSFFCCNGVSGWIEFKKAEANKIPSLTQDQINWHAALYRKGGRSFFFVRRRKELHAFHGGQGAQLLEEGLKGPVPIRVWKQPWSWPEIAGVLLA